MFFDWIVNALITRPQILSYVFLKNDSYKSLQNNGCDRSQEEIVTNLSFIRRAVCGTLHNVVYPMTKVITYSFKKHHDMKLHEAPSHSMT